MEARGCTWRVQGKILDTNEKPAAKIKVKIQARTAHPRGLWNDPNWPDPQTNKAGEFSVRSKTVHPCHSRRDIRLLIHDGQRWSQVAVESNKRQGTIDFGEVEVSNLYRIKCYPKTRDRDGDGYAKTGTDAVYKTVPRRFRYQCPKGSSIRRRIVMTGKKDSSGSVRKVREWQR